MPEVEVQYGNFAVWQRAWLEGEVLQGQLQYWTRQLKDIEPLELPADYPRSSAPFHRGRDCEFALGAELSSKLQELAHRQDVTLFMILLAAMQVLLARYSGQDDVVVGTPVANRNQLETEGTIGFFVNTLALRTGLHDQLSFRELLGFVRRVVLEGYEHQDIPFDRIVDALKLDRRLGRSPLFQTMLVVQRATPTLEFPGLHVSAIPLEKRTAAFDLSFLIQEGRQQLFGAAEYSCDLFDSETVERMVKHWQDLLQGVVGNEEERIGGLPLLSAEERRQQLVEWNGVERYEGGCLHRLFEEQARRRPDAVAVVYEGQQVSYRELNRQANRLGHWLRKQGVGPEVRVGLCMERSVEMVVGILGVLKAGGGYVPLDPQYPSERLNYMLEDAKVGVVVMEAKQQEWLQGYGGKVVWMRERSGGWEQESEEEVGSGVEAGNLGYIIYTSGSTGKPKGTEIDAWECGAAAAGNGEVVWIRGRGCVDDVPFLRV